jgi:hypothetical protein
MMTRFFTSLLVLAPLAAFGCDGFTKVGEGEDGGAGGETDEGEAGTLQSGGSAGHAGGKSGGSSGSGGTGNASGGRAGMTSAGGSNAGSPDSGGNGAGGGAAGTTNAGAGGSAGSSTMCQDASDCVLHDIACLACPNGEPACPNFTCVDGQCATSFPTCVGECDGDEDCPVGLAPCQVCPDGSSACPYAGCEDGQCQNGIETCDDVDPCEGKACGETCSVCQGADCSGAIPALMFCDETLTCQSNMPACTTPVCETDEECNMTDDCPQCPDVTGCAQRQCVEGACVLDCSAPPTDPCGGCVNDTVCVYQVGGPGPSAGMRCADQVVCDAPGACACIINEGTCTYTYGTAGDVGICVCDNGLE